MLKKCHMKNIEAVIPQVSVPETIDQLSTLEISDVVVETVKVYKKNLHQTMTHRGCTYDQKFIVESKLQFTVADQNASQAETILAKAVAH